MVSEVALESRDSDNGWLSGSRPVCPGSARIGRGPSGGRESLEGAGAGPGEDRERAGHVT